MIFNIAFPRGYILKPNIYNWIDEYPNEIVITGNVYLVPS
jgi:hypothetical protein